MANSCKVRVTDAFARACIKHGGKVENGTIVASPYLVTLLTQLGVVVDG